MSDETHPDPTDAPPSPSAPEAPPAAPSVDGVDPLRKILEALLPETGAKVEIEDVLGNRYSSPAKVPIRTQAQLFDLLRKHWEIVSGAASGGGADLLTAIASPEVLDDLVHALELTHPRAVSAAIEAQRKELGVEHDESIGAADCFDAEAILGAILPFFVGPILRLLTTARTTGLLRS